MMLPKLVWNESLPRKPRSVLKVLYFTYVGRLISAKGCAELVNAWAEFEKGQSDACTLLLVGDGPERAEFEQICIDREINSVRFLGQIQYDDIALYYAMSDIFVIPTLEDNWSLVVPEAMAAGLPILCSKYNGCWPELVREGENGWVFDPRDHAAFVNCLGQVIDRADQLAQMGKRSQRIVGDYGAEQAAMSILNACNLAIR